MKWDVMRKDDNGNEFRMASHTSRIDALAHVLTMESGVVHKQLHWVSGPPGPALTTNRDLYLHALRVGRQARAASWSLSAFLRALWKVSRPLRERQRLAADDVAAMFSAAASTPPGPYDPRWSSADLTLPGPAPVGHADWERVIFSQLADLEDFARHPRSTADRTAVQAPRPPEAGRRPTPRHWVNFEPNAYLECAVAGGFGGWDSADGARTPLPSAPARSPIRPLSIVTWADLSRLAVCGQLYE